MDGLEKVKRPMCALHKEKVRGGQSSELKMLNIVQCCPETPLLGGKHQTPSKFCERHIQEDSTTEVIVTPSEFKQYSKFSHNEVKLPDNEDDTLLIGCKKASNLNRFYDRTAGIFALVRPCGVIVNFSEMYTCESPTQAYVFTYMTFGRSLDDLARLKYLGYDRSCDLHPFLVNLEKRGSVGAKILLDNTKFMVDLWHCNKHKEPTCMPPDNPLCRYHPKLSIFSEVYGANTECAEQAFKWLGRFKHLTRRMSRSRYCFFLWKVIDLHNKRITRNLKQKNLLF